MNPIVPELSRVDMQALVDEQRKEYRLLGSQKYIRGLSIYEYDLTTGVLREAGIKADLSLTIDGKLDTTRRVDCKSLCLYVQALNKENAMRKVRKMLQRKSIRKEIFPST